MNSVNVRRLIDMKRGHTNVVNMDEAKIDELSRRLMIPLEGGASVDTCKELPPLALSKEEWVTIGRKAGWN